MPRVIIGGIEYVPRAEVPDLTRFAVDNPRAAYDQIRVDID